MPPSPQATGTSSTPLVLFITGCSSGFGSQLTLSALSSGHKVIATARNIDAISHLSSAGAKTFALDVTMPPTELTQLVNTTILPTYGKIDILINNAGYVQQGTVEEISYEETLKQYNTHVFGPLTLTRAVLPDMRRRKSGLIVNVGSVISWFGLPLESMYTSTKAALGNLTEALATEVAQFNIKAICIEPGDFDTLILAPGKRILAKNQISEYDGGVSRGHLEGLYGNQRGDVVKGTKVILDIIMERFWSQGNKTEDGSELPIRIPVGAETFLIKEALEKQLAAIDRLLPRVTDTDKDDYHE